jgi:DtxR family Mn-dependent transcriptional regulator
VVEPFGGRAVPSLVILLAGLVLLTLAVAVLVGRMRLTKLVQRWSPPGEQERLEDALKHIGDAECSGAPVTVDCLAGPLGVSEREAALFLSRLVERGLVRLSDEGYALTDEGRRRALRLLRAHRLWERYLADRTNVEPEKWHPRAERMEHALEADEADALALRLGHPRFDPHGDPIPGARGELPAPSGIPLIRLEPGRAGTITHLEDEPLEIYRALLAEGLAPGARVRVVDGGPQGFVFDMDGRRVTLEPSAAGNVTVEPLPAGTPAGEPRRTLAAAGIGETVVVAGLASSLRGPQRRRLLDLGLIPGTRVTPELESASGDPVAYRIRGALIALRRSQADAVEIEGAAAGTEREVVTDDRPSGRPVPRVG